MLELAKALSVQAIFLLTFGSKAWHQQTFSQLCANLTVALQIIIDIIITTFS